MRHGIAAEADREAGGRLFYLIRRALLQLVTIQRARIDGDYSDQITDRMFCRSPLPAIERVAATAPTQSCPSTTLAELIAAHEDEKEGETAQFTEKKKAKRKGTLHTIQRFFGADRQIQMARQNRTICVYSRADPPGWRL